MVAFTNISKFAPSSVEELKAQNWHKLDCLTRYKLRTESDPLKLKQWFQQQDEHWRIARYELFNERLRDRINRNAYMRY